LPAGASPTIYYPQGRPQVIISMIEPANGNLSNRDKRSRLKP